MHEDIEGVWFTCVYVTVHNKLTSAWKQVAWLHAYLKNDSSKSNPFNDFPVLFKESIYGVEVSSFVSWDFLKVTYKIDQIKPII